MSMMTFAKQRKERAAAVAALHAAMAAAEAARYAAPAEEIAEQAPEQAPEETVAKDAEVMESAIALPAIPETEDKPARARRKRKAAEDDAE